MPTARVSTEPIAPLTLVDRVRQRIWDWIQTDRLKPGDWLRIQDLARTLEVSDTPVREALIRLQQNGLVDTIPHVGTRVRRFTRQDIEELFDLREALECYALQCGAAHLSPETLRGLERQLEQAGVALEGGDVGPAVAADVALHTELIRAAGNSRILSLFENLRDQFKMFAGFGNRTAGGPQRFLAIHLRLVGLLRKGEIERATGLMREHMRLAKAQSLRGMRFLHVYAPCPTGWKHSPGLTVKIARLATECNVFPIYEVEEGVYTINRRNPTPQPVADYLKLQGRFHHLREEDLQFIQSRVNRDWDRLIKLEQAFGRGARE
jgi:DNA-binding GntR family transcriptional regulator